MKGLHPVKEISADVSGFTQSKSIRVYLTREKKYGGICIVRQEINNTALSSDCRRVVSVSRLWNSLPENVRGCRTLSKFKASLKHFVCKSK
ncbi:hypothetical protein C0J52_28045 [Blattella germanica]|nr:hypothetical protein C0J52_28045 [Blattella germanica]